MKEDYRRALVGLCNKVIVAAEISNHHSYHLAPFFDFAQDTLILVPQINEAGGKQALTELVLLILNEAAGRMTVSPSYFEDALEHCQRLLLPGTYEWFLKQREVIATGRPRWNQLLEKQITRAALLQTSVLPS